MVRGALAALLALEQDITVVAEAGRGDEVLALARKILPDVALLDIELPGSDGLEAAAQLRRELATVRARGFATCEDEFLEGVYSLSCPVPVPGRRIPLALGIEGFKEILFRKTDPARLLETVRTAANAIAPEIAGLLPPA